MVSSTFLVTDESRKIKVNPMAILESKIMKKKKKKRIGLLQYG
jgi:hypothetical protein